MAKILVKKAMTETSSGMGGAAYTHNQGTPATTWTIHHDLGYKPGGISIIDSGGTNIEGDIAHLTINTFVITIAYPTSGVVYVS